MCYDPWKFKVIWTGGLQIFSLTLYHWTTKADEVKKFLTSIWSVENFLAFLSANLIDGFNPAQNISRQCIKIAKYITTTFAYHSTSYLFNACNTINFKWEGSPSCTPNLRHPAARARIFNFCGSRSRFQVIDFASLCGVVGRYDHRQDIRETDLPALLLKYRWRR